jgi:hypothetical protein
MRTVVVIPSIITVVLRLFLLLQMAGRSVVRAEAIVTATTPVGQKVSDHVPRRPLESAEKSGRRQR